MIQVHFSHEVYQDRGDGCQLTGRSMPLLFHERHPGHELIAFPPQAAHALVSLVLVQELETVHDWPQKQVSCSPLAAVVRPELGQVCGVGAQKLPKTRCKSLGRSIEGSLA